MPPRKSIKQRKPAPKKGNKSAQERVTKKKSSRFMSVRVIHEGLDRSIFEEKQLKVLKSSIPPQLLMTASPVSKAAAVSMPTASPVSTSEMASTFKDQPPRLMRHSKLEAKLKILASSSSDRRLSITSQSTPQHLLQTQDGTGTAIGLSIMADQIKVEEEEEESKCTTEPLSQLQLSMQDELDSWFMEAKNDIKDVPYCERSSLCEIIIKCSEDAKKIIAEAGTSRTRSGNGEKGKLRHYLKKMDSWVKAVKERDFDFILPPKEESRHFALC